MPADSAIATWTLRQQAAALRERRISPLEAVDSALARIERLNPRLQAFTAVYDDRARAQAAAAQESGGGLHGVPVTVKDSFDVAGEPTLCGSRLRLGHRASSDSLVVQRLRAAGAILIGKTNVPELLANYESDNHVTGRTNNPWRLDRTSGGSSGGEAAAIASCLSAGGVGSDGGGSIRQPAHFCGIAGLKPTPGRVPAVGHFPKINHPGGLLGVAGPMARNTGDLRLLYTVLAGHDPRDPFSAPVPVDYAPAGGSRIALAHRVNGVPVSSAIHSAVTRAGQWLEEAGHAVEEREMPGLERAPNLWSFFFTRLPARFTARMIAGRESEMHRTGTEFLERALEQPEPDAREIVEALAERDRLRAALLGQMELYPVLLWPTMSVSAFKHGQRRFSTPDREIGMFQANFPLVLANLLGLPALVLPMGLDEDGLPVSVQLIGRPWEEWRLLDLAEELERRRGAFPAPPIE
ncbi:MAG: amidase [Acidobacteria bacterium]|nr:amidase [Acidobacteriota bacterium]